MTDPTLEVMKLAEKVATEYREGGWTPLQQVIAAVFGPVLADRDARITAHEEALRELEDAANDAASYLRIFVEEVESVGGRRQFATRTLLERIAAALAVARKMLEKGGEIMSTLQTAVAEARLEEAKWWNGLVHRLVTWCGEADKRMAALRKEKK